MFGIKLYGGINLREVEIKIIEIWSFLQKFIAFNQFFNPLAKKEKNMSYIFTNEGNKNISRAQTFANTSFSSFYNHKLPQKGPKFAKNHETFCSFNFLLLTKTIFLSITFFSKHILTKKMQISVKCDISSLTSKRHLQCRCLLKGNRQIISFNRNLHLFS